MSFLELSTPNYIKQLKAFATMFEGTFYYDAFWEKHTVTIPYKGTSAVLETFSKSYGKSASTYTRLRCNISLKKPVHIRLSCENFMTGIGHKIGIHDLATGDTEFDNKVYLKSRTPENILAILDNTVLRSSFLTLIASAEVYLELEELDKSSEGIPQQILSVFAIGKEDNLEILKVWFSILTLFYDRLQQLHYL
jgi:hypothetical protein